MRVVIADDEALARDRLKRFLKDIPGSEVVGEAAEGSRAIELCQEQQPDVVLLDIRMPGMDGLEAARHLITLAEPPAIIFTTAYDAYAIKAFELHAIDYLLKPLDPIAVRDTIRRVVRSGGQQPKKVLVVDDDPDVVDILRQILPESEFSLDSAPDGIAVINNQYFQSRSS